MAEANSVRRGKAHATAFEERRHRQRLAALAKGNETRFARARLKKALREEKVDPFELLRGDDAGEWEETAAAWALEKLLVEIPWVGQSRANDVMRVLRIPTGTLLGELTYARRRELAITTRGAREVDVDIDIGSP